MKTFRVVLAIGLLFSLGVGSAQAQGFACPEHVAGGVPPALLNPQLGQRTQGLCYHEFVLLHSAVVRTPLWSAEHLTTNRLNAAAGLPRPPSNAFHPEQRLAPGDRAELDDYVGSGYDRGHMSPNGDMPTRQAQHESFSLANMIPQHPCNNEVLWEGIESAVRDLTLDEGELYVVTGPIFAGSSTPFLNGRVGVPSQVFKAVFDPARRSAAAYVAQNADGMAYQAVPINQLAQMSGIDPFPAVPATVKAVAMSVPPPTPHHRCRLH